VCAFLCFPSHGVLLPCRAPRARANDGVSPADAAGGTHTCAAQLCLLVVTHIPALSSYTLVHSDASRGGLCQLAPRQQWALQLRTPPRDEWSEGSPTEERGELTFNFTSCVLPHPCYHTTHPRPTHLPNDKDIMTPPLELYLQLCCRAQDLLLLVGRPLLRAAACFLTAVGAVVAEPCFGCTRQRSPTQLNLTDCANILGTDEAHLAARSLACLRCFSHMTSHRVIPPEKTQ
jgi:hypothetical protein